MYHYMYVSGFSRTQVASVPVISLVLSGYRCILLFTHNEVLLTDIKALDHSMYVSGFSCTSVASVFSFLGTDLSAVHTQWTTPLRHTDYNSTLNPPS